MKTNSTSRFALIQIFLDRTRMDEVTTTYMVKAPSDYGVQRLSSVFTSSACSGYRYEFNGMEKDDEVKGRGNSYDFGARMYDSRLGRWFSIDKLFAKRPHESPYSFVGNNPIMNKEIDGNDYEVIVNKSESGNTITIRAIAYTDVVGSDSYNAAIKATEFWNSQCEKFVYCVSESDGSFTEYDIIFDLRVVPTTNKLDAQSRANDDKIGNSVIVLPDSQITDGLFGETEGGERAFVANSRKETDTPAHEVGHWLNLGHFEIGLMKEIDKYGMITREAEITIENIQQIINYSIEKTAVDASTAPEGTVGKTTLTNPQGNKVEGVVELKE